MAPGPKKKSFHTPRNTKNNQNNKTNEKLNCDLNDESDKINDAATCVTVDSNTSDNKKFTKRSIESNWTKYEEPQIDPHGDHKRGNDFEVLLSYSGGSGSQLKLQDEKDWEDDCLNVKDISLNLKDLINSIKCIPFHERIDVKNIFGDKHIKNFTSGAANWRKSYTSRRAESQALQLKDNTPPVDPFLTIIEEPDSVESDDLLSIKNFVQDKTVNIINSLASNLTFKEIPEKEKLTPEKECRVFENEKKSEVANNDLDFLLSLNISSKASVKEESAEVSKSSNVDDWLNSILDD